MDSWRHPRLHDPANWFLLVGAALLVASVWVPWYTATRTARIELRAEAVATTLLEAARDLDAAWNDGTAAFVAARCYALAAAHEVFHADLEVVEGVLPDVFLRLTSKHYAFQLAASLPPVRAMPSPDAVPAIEVLAWPMSPAGPGHSVFFLPENAPRAYTRNKSANYHGVGPGAPRPGSTHRPSEGSVSPRFYRSGNDERWILY